MEERIIIYKTAWDDISPIRRLLNTYLLRYKIVGVSEEISSKPNIALPIVEVYGQYLYNPTTAELRQALGLNREPVADFHDLVIIGSGLEAHFLLDYAIKQHIDAVCLQEGEISQLEEFHKAYGSILHLPNPFLDSYIYDIIPDTVRMTDNRRYIEIVAGEKRIYARGLVLALDTKPTQFYVDGEDAVLEENLFFDMQGLITKSKEKRVRNARTRMFALIGNHQHILQKALIFCDEIKQLDEYIQFELHIISPLDFMLADKVLLRKLRKLNNVKILGKTEVLSFEKKDYQVVVETDMLSYTFDRVLGYNEPSVQNEAIDKLLPFARSGFPETDHTGKTSFANIYSIVTKEYDNPGDKRLEYLDTYIACAGIIQQIKRYLDDH